MLVFTVLALTALQGQSSQLRPYTLTDGLPQSQVFDVVQDQLGYIWMGTQGGGICRFDGQQFKTWTEADGLGSNYINTLAVAGDSLYIGNANGLSIKTGGKFLHYKGNPVISILQVAGKIYLGTTLGVFHLETPESLTQLHLSSDIDLLRINDIKYDGSHFWLATNRGLWRLSTLDQSAEPQLIKKDNYQSLALRDSSIFAASFQNGILQVDIRSGKIIPTAFGPGRINQIAFLGDKQLWVATDNAGIFLYDTDDLSFLRKIDRETGLSVFHIRKCFQDRQGNIWIATSGGGIYKYAPSNFLHYDRESGLNGNRVYAVLQAEQAMLVSNSEAGLVRIDSLGVRDTLHDPRLLNVKIKALAADAAGNAWIGTEGRGLYVAGTTEKDSMVIDTTMSPPKIDTLQSRISFIRAINERVGFHGRWIRKILIKQEQIWVATYSSGIYRFSYDIERDSLYGLQYFGRSDGITELLINDLQLDSLGRIWYATKRGHLGYIEKSKVHHLGNVLHQPTDIVSLCIHENGLFLGTAGRGIWYTSLDSTEALVPLEGVKALTSNNIYQLIFDAEGNLWAGSERGVDQILLNDSRQIVDVLHYNRNDGFLGIETCQNAAIRDQDDNLWFGTIYGLTRYKPLENTQTRIKPTIAFERIEVLYKALDTIHLMEWAAADKLLELAPRENHLAFKYRTVDINNPEKIQYRWRLNAAEWSPWQEDNSVNFAGLSYGDHRFEAQSRTENWEESDVIGFRFHIAQPLHEQTWFRRSVIGGLLLILGSLIWRYIRRLKARNRAERQRLEMENHLLSLEQKALRLQMNPHFVFNVLNGIKAMSNGEADKMHDTINKFATLLRAILNNSRQDSITLDQEISTLRNYIEVESLMATKKFTYTIDVDQTLDKEEILIPPMLVQPFVENSIRHGIMSVQREGVLEICFWQKDHYLYCSVTDNGIGIHTAQSAKKATNHQSVALEVTRERIASLSGPKSLLIDEVVGPQGETAGTKVEFRLPLMTDY